MMKKVIITGATGFVGSAVAKKIMSTGTAVVGVDVDQTALEQMKQYGDFTPVIADFSFYDKLEQLIAKDDYDVFYHFAWQGVFGEAFKDYSMQIKDVQFACDALLKAKEIGCKKFVFAGTFNQYEIVTRIINEKPNPRWTCIYSTAKLAADMMCKTIAHHSGIEYNAGLIAMIYGVGNKAKTVPNVVMDCLNRSEIPKLVPADTPYDMIYIDDVAEAFMQIGLKGINQRSYYIGHRVMQTMGDVVGAMRDVLHPNIRIAFGEYPDTMVMDFSLVDQNALYQDTGFECKADFKESILATAKWLDSSQKTVATPHTKLPENVNTGE